MADVLAVEAPDFDLIREETGRATSDALRMQWYVLNDELSRRRRAVRSAVEKLEGKVFESAPTTTQNDFNTQEALIVRFTGSTGFSLTGLANGVEGRIVFLLVTGTATVTVLHNSGLSVAANRIRLQSLVDVDLTTDRGMVLQYTGSLWRELYLAGGLTFPATQATTVGVNVLDDYEEGTWTPTLTFATPGDLAVVYSVRVGRYTKVGDSVQATFGVVTTTFTHTTAAGALQVTGLPFIGVGTTDLIHMGTVQFNGLKTDPTAFTQIVSRASPSSTIVDFVGCGLGLAQAALAVGNTTSGTQVVLRSTLSYQTST